LHQSRAIGHYIATKYADQGTLGLIPTELNAFGQFQQGCQIEEWYFEKYTAKALVVMPLYGLQVDQAAFDRNIASINKNLDVYEKILSKQKYLAGDVICFSLS
jgi:glutathione S-transferase